MINSLLKNVNDLKKNDVLVKKTNDKLKKKIKILCFFYFVVGDLFIDHKNVG